MTVCESESAISPACWKYRNMKYPGCRTGGQNQIWDFLQGASSSSGTTRRSLTSRLPYFVRCHSCAGDQFRQRETRRLRRSAGAEGSDRRAGDRRIYRCIGGAGGYGRPGERPRFQLATNANTKQKSKQSVNVFTPNVSPRLERRRHASSNDQSSTPLSLPNNNGLFNTVASVCRER